MNWQEFFKLIIHRQMASGTRKFFEANLSVSDDFSLQKLMMKEFESWNLSETEKKKLSLAQRKILLGHDIFRSQEFKKICKSFEVKLSQMKGETLNFSTQGGGVYLFLACMNRPSLRNKKVICYTSELPLSILAGPIPKNLKFIFRPEEKSYLVDFPSLWQESDIMTLFELQDFNSEVA